MSCSTRMCFGKSHYPQCVRYKSWLRVSWTGLGKVIAVLRKVIAILRIVYSLMVATAGSTTGCWYDCDTALPGVERFVGVESVVE